MYSDLTLYLMELTVYDPTVAGERTFYFASGRGFVTGPNAVPANQFYDPRISQAADVTRSAFAPTSTRGRAQTSYGDIILLNGDGGVDNLRDCRFNGRKLVVYASDVVNPVYPGDFQIEFYGTMADAYFTNNELHIQPQDRSAELTVPLNTTKYLGNNALPNGLEGVSTDLLGKPKPVCYGVVTGIQPPCVNTTKLIYQVNDGPVSSVDNVYDRGVALTIGATYADLTSLLDDAQAPAGGAFKACPSLGYFRLGSSPAGGHPTCDVTEGPTSADRTTAQIYQRLLQRTQLANANLAASGQRNIDTDGGADLVTDTGVTLIAISNTSEADLTALDSAAGYIIGYWEDKETTIADAIDQVAASVGAAWFLDVNGIFRIKQLTAPSGSPVLSITQSMMLKPLDGKISNDPDHGVPIFRSVVNWGQNYTVQTSDIATSVTDARKAVIGQQWRQAIATDTTVQMSDLLSTELDENTCLTASADAQSEATRRLALRSIRRDIWAVAVPLNHETRAVELFDVIELDHPRYDLSVVGNDSSNALFRVLDIIKNASDRTVEFTVWGRPTQKNLATNGGALFVTDTGSYMLAQQGA